MNRTSLRLLIPVFLLSTCLGHAEDNRSRIQGWETSFQIGNLLKRMDQSADPTLKAPRLVPEPEYTGGTSNTIHWYADSVYGYLAPLGKVLLFFEVQAEYLGTEVWGFVDAGRDSATFVDLPGETPIEYRLRYYAQRTDGAFELSHWSDPVQSIQDITPPKIWPESGILNVEESGGKRWVLDSSIQLRVVASDSINGKVMQISVRESSSVVDRITYYSDFIPSIRIDETISYELRSREEIPVIISWWVNDVALQQSEVVSDTIFWWPSDEELSRLVCFPNPFNPKVETLSIQVNAPGVTEARIFDPFGNLIRILKKASFDRTFEWDGKNERGDLVATGGYICVLKGKERIYCKIAVIK